MAHLVLCCEVTPKKTRTKRAASPHGACNGYRATYVFSATQRAALGHITYEYYLRHRIGWIIGMMVRIAISIELSTLRP